MRAEGRAEERDQSLPRRRLPLQYTFPLQVHADLVPRLRRRPHAHERAPHEEQGVHPITYQIYETHDVPNSHDGTSKRTYSMPRPSEAPPGSGFSRVGSR